MNLLTPPHAESDGGLMHETRVGRDIQLKIVRKLSSGMIARCGARHRRGNVGAPPRAIPPRAGPPDRRDDEGRRGAARRRRAAGPKR